MAQKPHIQRKTIWQMLTTAESRCLLYYSFYSSVCLKIYITKSWENKNKTGLISTSLFHRQDDIKNIQ